MKEKIKHIIRNNTVFRALLGPMHRKILKIQRNKIFKSTALEALNKLHNVLEGQDIEYWLEFGTLLGAVREKGFIAHDLDIDIGLFMTADNEKVSELLSQSGFVKYRTISIDDGKYGLEETYTYKGLSIDFFYFTRRDDKMFCHVFSNEYGKSWDKTIEDRGGLIVYEHTFPYDGFEESMFLGKKVLIPKNVHKHLVAQYGETYMVKDKKWNPYDMAPNKEILEDKIGVVKSYATS